MVVLWIFQPKYVHEDSLIQGAPPRLVYIVGTIQASVWWSHQSRNSEAMRQ